MPMPQLPGRISKKHDFDRIFKQGKNAYTAGMGLHFLAKNSGQPRLAIIVSRATEKRAVRRNKIKRRVREIFRQKDGLLPGDYVFVVKKDLLKDSFLQLEQKILNLLKRTIA